MNDPTSSDDLPRFNRQNRYGEQLGELRINLPISTLVVLDAQVRALGYDGRTELVAKVLRTWAEEEFHKASVLVDIVRGNPTLSEQPGSADAGARQ